MEEEIKEKKTQEVQGQDGEAQQEQQDSTEKPLDKMTAKELREVALKIPGITGVHAMKKAELLAVVKEARGIKDEEAPSKKKKDKVAKAAVSILALKRKIGELKDEKEKARQGNDKARVDILRRRINRLKKRTRQVA
jgi:hypothetical protein